MQPKTIVNLFMVGAPKCGTTSLYDYFRQHPDVSVGTIKEPHFFCDDFDEYRHVTTVEDYSRLYPAKESKKYSLDASTNYLFSKTAVNNISEYCPQAKIIVMLRNPVDLIRSLHQHLVFRQLEPETDLAKAWKLGPLRNRAPKFAKANPYPGHLEYRTVGLLSQHLQRVLDNAGSCEVGTFFLDDLVAGKPEFLERACEFLALKYCPDIQLAHKNTARSNRSKILSRLYFHNGPIVGYMKKVAKRIPLLNKLDLPNLLSSDNKPAQMPDALRAEIRDFFSEDIKTLSQMTERNLDHWTAV